MTWHKRQFFGDYRMNKYRFQKIFWLIAGIIIAIIIFISLISGFLQKWLWMNQMGYSTIFWRIVLIKWILFAASFLFVYFYIWINFKIVKLKTFTNSWKFVRRIGEEQAIEYMPVAQTIWAIIRVFISLFIALMFALSFFPQWDTFLRFRWGKATGVIDPIFHIDTGFYLFQLPFYKLLQDGILSLAFLTVLLIAAAYAWAGAFRVTMDRRIQVEQHTVGHLSAQANNCHFRRQCRDGIYT
jgi:uncharacterized membrane protein (UPF0182 family)